MKEVNSNFVALRKNHLELLELKNMLKKTEIFLEESRLGFNDADENTSKSILWRNFVQMRISGEVLFVKIAQKKLGPVSAKYFDFGPIRYCQFF